MSAPAGHGLRNLLVAFNGSEASVSALRHGIALARNGDTHLTGLLAHGSSLVSRAIPAWFSDPLRRSILETVSARAEAIHQRFDDETGGLIRGDRLHWLEIGGDPDRTVSDYSCMFDLTLIGQFEALGSAEELALNPARICEESGRPVMVVPRHNAAPATPSHALIAWDGMRSGTGAVAAALPLLRKAGRITALTVETGHTGTPLQGIDLLEMLRRHGLDCDWRHEPGGESGAAEQILDLARTSQADLLIMGVSSHGPVGRMIGGSVTTSIMERTPIPLFLSH